MRAKTIITVMVLLAVAMIAVPSADAARSLHYSDKCWSPKLLKWVYHGEMGKTMCCWYGDWTHKSKCGGHDDDKDKDKCWSPLWNKHVHHGEMGAKKCCWYGDWTHKSKCDGQ